MSISLVQSVVGSGSSTASITITGVTTGNLVVVFLVGFDNTNPLLITGISDGTNTYSQVSNAYAVYPTNGSSDIWYAPNVTGGDLTVDVTFSPDGSVANTMVVAEFSGADTSSPVYGGQHLDAGGNSQWQGPDCTSTHAADMFVACGYWNDVSATTGAGGWTEIIPGGITSQNYDFPCVYYAPGSASTQHGQSNPVDASFNWCSSGAVILASGSPPPPSNIATSFLVFE